jgi:hypothetical protein
MTPFSDLMAAMQPVNNNANHPHTTALPADGLQGRTAYRGLSAALCLQATHRSMPDRGDDCSLAR